MSIKIPFNALRPTDDAARVDAAIRRVVESGWFVLGPEVEAFEREFAAACGTSHAVSVGTGTDAIALIFRGLGIGTGDEVITTPLSAAYSALAIMMAGARPVFVDLDPDRLTIDPARIASAITPRTKAVLPVHLYGQAADMDPILDIASRHGLAVVEDCAQAVLTTCTGRPVGTMGVAGAFSFYPTKNLGALGDGGAIATNDAALAARIVRLRNGGQSKRYHHDEFGVNTRLDELQAAILRERLAFLPHWTSQRRTLAAAYRRGLAGAPVTVPAEFDAGHVYHLFPVLTAERDRFQQHMRAHGVETLVHYPIPIPNQPALASEAPARCPLADRICDELVSLPMYPSLTIEQVHHVTAAVQAFAPAQAPRA
jgi:dTDP-4-amino-4,6-dideoxygalactose transaminase